jgi:hypothetical protein
MTHLILDIISLWSVNNVLNGVILIVMFAYILVERSGLSFFNWFMICSDPRFNTFIYLLRTFSRDFIDGGMLVNIGNSITNDFGFLILFNMIILNSCGLFKKFKSIVEAWIIMKATSHIFGHAWWRSIFSLWWSWHFYFFKIFFGFEKD